MAANAAFFDVFLRRLRTSGVAEGFVIGANNGSEFTDDEAFRLNLRVTNGIPRNCLLAGAMDSVGAPNALQGVGSGTIGLVATHETPVICSWADKYGVSGQEDYVRVLEATKTVAAPDGDATVYPYLEYDPMTDVSTLAYSYYNYKVYKGDAVTPYMWLPAHTTWTAAGNRVVAPIYPVPGEEPFKCFSGVDQPASEAKGGLLRPFDPTSYGLSLGNGWCYFIYEMTTPQVISEYFIGWRTSFGGQITRTGFPTKWKMFYRATAGGAWQLLDDRTAGETPTFSEPWSGSSFTLTTPRTVYGIAMQVRAQYPNIVSGAPMPLGQIKFLGTSRSQDWYYIDQGMMQNPEGTQVYRVYLGKVTIASGVISSCTTWAYGGRYRSPWTLLQAGSPTATLNHNLGCIPERVDVRISVPNQAEDISMNDTRDSCVCCRLTDTNLLVARSTYGYMFNFLIPATPSQYHRYLSGYVRVIAERGF